MRQHKNMTQTSGHALVHKTWVCHDPAKRQEKTRTWWQNHLLF